METKKILGIIFSIVFLGAFAFVLSWGIINFNKVKDGMSGTQLYTNEDIEKAYQDGYDTALKNKNEYEDLINSYRDTITNMSDNISQITSQVNDLKATNTTSQTQIENLTNIKTQNEARIQELEQIIQANDESIVSLNEQIALYQIQLNNLIATNNDNTELIIQLNSQIRNLQVLSTQLQTTNELNLVTINNLNNQISSLNTQIAELGSQIENNDSKVNSLNIKIVELEKSIAYYEQYIANLETNDQVIATFEFDNSIYNIQVLPAGSKVSVVNPESTNYVVFNCWTVNGVEVDLNTFKVNTSTRFIADVTYYYDVFFMIDGENVAHQMVTKNNFAINTMKPQKDNYEFDGWTINGKDIVNINNYPITENITFIAKFTQVHEVIFIYNNEIINRQLIRNGEFANAPNLSVLENEIFNGWALNDCIVNIETTSILGSISFVANITKCYEIIYMVDNEIWGQEIVLEGKTPLLTTVPVKEGSSFKGWSIDGVNIINTATYVVNNNVEFIAIFNEYVAGFYDTKDNLSLTWEELLERNYFRILSGGYIANGSQIASLKSYYGKLVLSNDVVGIVNSSVASSGFCNNMTNITSITIPESVRAIGNYAFYGCSYLTEINFYAENCADFDPRGYIFYQAGKNEEGITVNFGNTVKRIPFGFSCPHINDDKAFPNITEINIGKNVESIGDYAFYKLRNLNKVTYGAKNCSDLGERANNFAYSGSNVGGFDVFFDNNVVRIPSYLFSFSSVSTNGALLKNIHIGNSVQYIGNYAFGYDFSIKDCGVYIDSLEHWLTINFESLILSNPLENRRYLYVNNEIVTDVVIPNTITAILPYAFVGYTELTSVSIPDSVESIGRYAFNSCDNLVNVRFSSNVTTIGDSVFQYCDNIQYNIYDNAKYLGNENNLYILLVRAIDTNITNCIINSNCKLVQDNAFVNCSNIATLYIPRNVRLITDFTFYGCKVLTIYCELNEQEIPFKTNWNKTSSTTFSIVKYGYSLSEYQTETGR